MGKKKLILIIDDDEDDRSILSDAIGEVDSSCTCMQGIGGVEALERLMLAELLPDLIFLDLNMPRMSGKEFLTKLKQDERFKNIPVIMYSTSARKEDIDETKRQGAVCFLTKPVLFGDICREISLLLNRDW
ncbi:MAG: response regulator [Bacteroidia bacterium]